MILGNGCPDVIVGEIVDRPEHLTPANFLLAPRHAFVSGFMLRDSNAPVQAFRHAHSNQHGAVFRIGAVGWERVDKLMEPAFAAGIFLDGERVLRVNPDRFVLRIPNTDEILLRGERVCELKGNLIPIRRDFGQLHDVLHIVHRRLPLSFLIEPEYLERQTPALLRNHKRHAEKNCTVLAAGHADDHIVVAVEDHPQPFQCFIEYVVLQVDHCC